MKKTKLSEHVEIDQYLSANEIVVDFATNGSSNYIITQQPSSSQVNVRVIPSTSFSYSYLANMMISNSQDFVSFGKNYQLNSSPFEFVIQLVFYRPISDYVSHNIYINNCINSFFGKIYSHNRVLISNPKPSLKEAQLIVTDMRYLDVTYYYFGDKKGHGVSDSGLEGTTLFKANEKGLILSRGSDEVTFFSNKSGFIWK